MSEYSFGYDDPGDDPGEETSQGQGPKPLRDHLKRISEQLSELKAENDRLKTEQRQKAVADALKEKGYSSGAAKLFSGEPEKLDEWLQAHGEALAKLPTSPNEGEGDDDQEQQPAGPPASTVPAEDQARMRTMQEAGATGAAPSQGTDKEIAAQIAAAQTPEEYAKILRAHGNRFDW